MSEWRAGRPLNEPTIGPHGFVYTQLLHRGQKHLVYRAIKANKKVSSPLKERRNRN
jgi:hypothetical protein